MATSDCGRCRRCGSDRIAGSGCINCTEYKRRYNKLPETLQRNRDRRRRDTEFIRSLIISLKSAACADCHHTFPHYVMDFDHVNGRKGADFLSNYRSVPAFVRELEKCEVVCANCHKIRTWTREHK